MSHPAGSFRRPDHIKSPLYVVTPIFNPVRFRSRWKLYHDFAKMCEDAGAILYTAEIALGEREHVLTDPNNPRHVQLRTKHELWFKENVINVLVSRLPADWRYVAWVDADTRFVRDDWANETLHRLQHHDVVQMWSQYQDLNPEQELIGTAPSFVHNAMININVDVHIRCTCSCKPCTCPPCYYPYGKPRPGQKGYPGAPGLAWAATRHAWNTFGGLLDTCILGAGDWYMAHGLYGLINDRMVNRSNHERYRETIFRWQERAMRLRQNVGVVPGLALHYWHGPKVQRKYGTREQILIDTQFNPETHLSRDWQGLWQFTPAAPTALRDRVRHYFHERNEDAV